MTARPRIPQKVQNALWARAAGRCQFRGCNEDLVGDLISGRTSGTYGFIAHIVSHIRTGPRGHPELSPQLAKDLANLMILCARHHKVVDDPDAVAEFPVELLLAMKAEHEARALRNTGVDQDRTSHVLRFATSIGATEALVSTRDIHAAMMPGRQPATTETIDLEMINCPYSEMDPEFWAVQRDNLRQGYAAKILGRIERQDIRHLSVFALAPQPLLIDLGRLMGDLTPATIHQRHREPPTWAWQPDQPAMTFIETAPRPDAAGAVALKIGISAKVTDDRIRAVLGDDAAIWAIEAENGGVDILRRPEDQVVYRQRLRRIFDAIKARHGQHTIIHLFPVMPASLAVETGRVWMPKADAPLRLYDNLYERGFVVAFDLGGAPVTRSYEADRAA